MLTGMVQYGHKIEEKVKAMQSEIKENVQGTNGDRKETRNQEGNQQFGPEGKSKRPTSTE